MKIFFVKLTVFTLGLIGTIILPIGLISKYDNLDKEVSENHNVISLQTKSMYDSLDVLFVGNSYCYSSIDTKYLDSLGISSFNLGIATAGVEFYDLLLNDYFGNIKTPPKKLFLLVSPMTFSSKSDNYSAYPIHRYLENELSNVDVAFRYQKIKKLSSMYRKSVEKGLINIIDRVSENKHNQRFNQKGFYTNDKIVDDSVISSTRHLYLPLKNDSFDKTKVKTLLRTADYYQKKGIEVVFFELPTNLLNEYFCNSYLSEYKYEVENISDNFKFVSISKDIFSLDNYRNIDHMNSSGARIATKEIVKLIE